MNDHVQQKNVLLVLLIAVTLVNIFVENEKITTVFNVVAFAIALFIVGLTKRKKKTDQS